MFKIIERVLWTIAIAGLAAYPLSIGERWFYQEELSLRLDERLNAPPPPPSPLEVKFAEGDPLGRLEIPDIALSAILTEGVDGRSLRRSIGHVPGTALPGANGNVALSGHRDTFFRRLGEIRRGTRISVTSVEGTFQYVVESTSIVDPDKSAVLRDVGRPTLTLVTCYPFYYVGSAPKRFIVHAGLASH